MTSGQSAVLLAWVHLLDKWGPCWWERRDNLFKVARIKSNSLKMRQLACINACVTLSHDWPVCGSSPLVLITRLKTWPLTSLDHKRNPSALGTQKMRCQCCDRGICRPSWPRDLITGWQADSLSPCLCRWTKKPQCHRKCKAGCVLCNQFALRKPGLSQKWISHCSFK